MCALGTYCDVDAVCQSVKSPGDECDASNECGFGSACVTFAETAPLSSCSQWGSIENGKQILLPTDTLFPNDFLCESGFLWEDRSEGIDNL